MECRACSENLTAYIDGELTAEERQALSSHLEACQECSGEHTSLLFSTQVVDLYGKETLNSPAWSLIEERIAPQPTTWGDFRWLFQARWAGALAVLLLVAFSAPFYWNSTQPNALLEQQLAAFVNQRDATEEIHQGIIEIEPVGWVTHNPFRDYGSDTGNPFSLD